MKKKILISSDCNYENLVAEIYFDDKFIALVTYDEKWNFFVETSENNWNILSYDDFISSLEEAKIKLMN